MTNNLVSIIVPVYNVFEYLEECVSSLINQTYKNLEILLIDDGSTDESGNLCDLLKKTDERIIVYHKPNGGLSDARNYGMSHCHGDFFVFVDSDDLLDKTMIENLIEVQAETNCEVVCCKYDLVFDNHYVKSSLSICGKINSEDIFLLFVKGTILHSACGKLFKSNILSDLTFPIGRYYEDEFVMYDIVLEHSCAVSSDAIYIYRKREGSITHSSNMEKQTIDLFVALEHVESVVRSKFPNLDYALDYKVLQDSLELLKNEIKYGKNTFITDNCRKKIRHLKYKNLKRCGIGYSYKLEFLLIQISFLLYRKLYQFVVRFRLNGIS